MTASLKPRPAILPPAQKRLWPSLGFTRENGFVLYGGTAVALRCGHRISIDFDFFSDRPLDKSLIYSCLPLSKNAVVLQEETQSLTLLLNAGKPDENDIKISFFGKIGIGRVSDPDVTDDGVLQVASVDDLMATKLKVILQRIEAKDYRDISALIRSGASLATGLAAARLMYGNQFQPMESLKAITYFKGGDLDTLTTAEKEILIHAASHVSTLPEVHILSRSLASVGS